MKEEYKQKEEYKERIIDLVNQGDELAAQNKIDKIRTFGSDKLADELWKCYQNAVISLLNKT